MATMNEIRAALRNLALRVDVDEETGRLTEAIPVPLAQRLCASLNDAADDASWTHDAEDRELAWVTVVVSP
jgi:hypothetical protein